MAISVESPEVTVLLSVFNAERYLNEAIDSILTQTFTDFEFIIIDDGSSDRSLQILQQYAQQDSRIQLVARENRGLVSSLNEGLALAKAPFIARMDADDVSYPDRLSKQVDFLINHPDFAAIGCKVRLIDEDSDPLRLFSLETTHREIDAAHLQGQGGAIAHAAAMFRKDKLNFIGRFRSEFTHAEDLDLWLRLAEVGQLGNLPDVLYDYRQHLQSVGHKYRAEQINSANNAVKDAMKRRGILNENFKISEPPLSDGNELLLKWGWWALSAGNVKTAKKYAIKALKKNPFSFETLKLYACALRGY